MTPIVDKIWYCPAKLYVVYESIQLQAFWQRDADRIGGDDDGKNDELFVPGLARGPAGSNCQEGRNSGTDTTRDWDDCDEDISHQNDCDDGGWKEGDD